MSLMGICTFSLPSYFPQPLWSGRVSKIFAESGQKLTPPPISSGSSDRISAFSQLRLILPKITKSLKSTNAH